MLNSSAPVLAGGDDYDVYGMTGASVVEFNDVLYMFYIGAEAWETVLGGARKPVRETLNLATSTTGITWTKHPGNPLNVDLGGRKELGSVAAQVVGDTIHLWLTDNYADPTIGEAERSAVGYYLFNPDDEY